QIAREPRARIRFVLPAKDIVPANLAIRINGKSELIAAAIVGEEEQVSKGHVEFSEALIRAELLIMLSDIGYRPCQPGTKIRVYAVEFQQQLAKVLRELNAKLPLNRRELSQGPWLGKLRVYRSGSN